MEIRKVKIEEYWPLIVRGTEEFGQIAVAENPEFNRLAESVYGCLKESFILPGEEEHATEYGVSRWEKMLGLAVTPDMTLDDRKAAILTYMSIKLPYTWRVLKQMLTELLGEGNFTLSFDNETQVLSVGIASTVEHLRPQVEDLFTRVVPQNIEITYDPLPIDYTRVEYLESTGTQIIGIPAIIDTSVTVVACEFSREHTYGNQHPWAMSSPIGEGQYRTGLRIVGGNSSTGEQPILFMRPSTAWWTIAISSAKLGEKHNIVVDYSQNKIYCDGELKSEFSKSALVFSGYCGVFGHFHNIDDGVVYTDYLRGRVSYFSVSVNGEKQCDIVSALDPTGTPCMFDLVTQTPFYNSGTGDFLYPTDSAPAMTTDLDDKFYAKLTEHGVRRLYKVPEGCTLSKDEYAAKHGFKELVEPPMPQTGYWTNVWKETDTQLICEWVETEPPMDVTEND